MACREPGSPCSHTVGFVYNQFFVFILEFGMDAFLNTDCGSCKRCRRS